MNKFFLSSSQTRRLLFYLTIICNLACCAYSQNDDGQSSGCTYTYPPFMSASTPYARIEMISCRKMAKDVLPLYENVTKMELIRVPITVLNQSEIPKAVQSPEVDLRQLHWTKSHITVLQSITVPNLTELDLSDNTIQDIHQQAFEPLVLLHKLNLSHNVVEKLPENLFTKFSPLRVLSLSHNRLKILPGDVFDNLNDLEILDLSNNEINYLREDTFSSNGKLLHLDLSNNKLNTLPERLFHPLAALQHLSLYGNVLIHFEAQAFSKLSSLMVLNIGKNPLWTLPNSLLPTNNTLFILTISHTRLVKINPSVFQNLRSLRKLYLSDNRNLQNLHNDTFVNSETLKIVDLQNNNFTQLPFSIVNLIPDELLLDGNRWPCDCTVQWIVNWIKSLGESKNNVRLTSYCNSTDKELTEIVYRMQCKPTIVRVSPISYQNLEIKVQLICRAYANPRPLLSWVTPRGLSYINSESALDLLRYHPTFDTYPHLENTQNVLLHENGDLDINSMTRDDAGEYLCIATNKVGESFALTRVYVDPSIMQRIKTGSLICGLLWINGFLLFSVVYVLIRRCTKRAKEEKRKRRMHENMDIYKSQQINKLRERCKNQMNRIKNNCSIQVEWMKENYMEFMKNTQDHRSSYLTTQYNQQMTEIREYYLTQMHKVREHYEQQRNLILEFSINQSLEPKTTCRTAKNGDILMKMENGNISANILPEEDVYKYNDAMKSEIQKLTSLRNLHEVFLDGDKVKTKCEFGMPVISKDEIRKNDHENGKLKTPPDIEDEEDENTNMLANCKG